MTIRASKTSAAKISAAKVSANKISASRIRACHYETPVGTMTVLAFGDASESGPDSDFTVVAAGFCSSDDLWERLPAEDKAGQPGPELVDRIGATHDAIVAYLGGDLDALKKVAVRQAGTDLQQQVWAGLRKIPAGETRTYTELAQTTSKPKAVRAVGTACGRNLIAPFVPCHRALRSDGSLGGYYYGLEVKQWLLAHEGYRSAKKSRGEPTTGQLTLPT